MDNRMEKYLKRFEGARVTEVNEYLNINFSLKDNSIKYILLEGGWRLFCDHKMVMTKSEFKNASDVKKSCRCNC